MHKVPTLAFFIVWFTHSTGIGQPVDAPFREESISRIADLISKNYVLPDVGKATGDHLKERLKAGAFNDAKQMVQFANAVTRSAQEINHDKHMRVGLIRPDRPDQDRFDESMGFRESVVMEGNVGYIDIRDFVPVSMASKTADSHMKKVAGVDALIIDLRRNGGGDPAMVQYMCSYFFDKRVHLNSIYRRTTGDTTEYWTIPVRGKKMPQVPIYVLTSQFTFSGAEEFAYNMKTQKRATLIGETTGGGANPGDRFDINDKLFIFIPTGRAINPITHTNWEGTGVSADIQVPADQALEKALELARKQ